MAVNDSYTIFGWVVIGAMTGAIGGRFPRDQESGLGIVITGVIGALAGGFAVSAAFGPPDGTRGDLLANLAGALLGAFLFVFLGRRISRLVRTHGRVRGPRAPGRPTRSST